VDAGSIESPDHFDGEMVAKAKALGLDS